LLALFFDLEDGGDMFLQNMLIFDVLYRVIFYNHWDVPYSNFYEVSLDPKCGESTFHDSQG
jgi:hypothetical protein